MSGLGQHFCTYPSPKQQATIVTVVQGGRVIRLKKLLGHRFMVAKALLLRNFIFISFKERLLFNNTNIWLSYWIRNDIDQLSVFFLDF